MFCILYLLIVKKHCELKKCKLDLKSLALKYYHIITMRAICLSHKVNGSSHRAESLPRKTGYWYTKHRSNTNTVRRLWLWHLLEFQAAGQMKVHGGEGMSMNSVMEMSVQSVAWKRMPLWAPKTAETVWGLHNHWSDSGVDRHWLLDCISEHAHSSHSFMKTTAIRHDKQPIAGSSS